MASWIDKVKTKFAVTAGDGATYTPKSFNANRATEFNFAEFTFRNLDGTLVDRRRPMGAVYNLELYFEGADCIDIATKFQKSANNSKPWTIKHPFYDTIKVQPISPVFHDNANNLLNVTKITVTVRETISAKNITNTESAPDAITANAASTAKFFADYYVSVVPTPTVTDTEQMQSDLTKFQKALQKVSDIDGKIVNAYNRAKAAVSNVFNTANAVTDNLSFAVANIQALINLPATIEDSIFNRVSYLNSELNTLVDQVANLSLPPLPDFKEQWESLVNLWFAESGTCISAICLASVTNISPTDYQYNNQVLTIISQITTAYNKYLQNADALQSYNGATPGNFVADPQSIIALDNLVSYTVLTLFTIQATAKQPRTITLSKDNNVINIAYQLYGLIPDDSTIDRIIADNDIYGDELIQVLKGRQILYYV